MSSPRGSWLESWHVNPSLNKDYDSIDGLRGIAILLVVLCHSVYTNPAAAGFVHFVGGIFTAGTFGVTVFFTLSGFLISLPFWKRKVRNEKRAVPPGYFGRRFWKIVPPLALSIVLFALLYAWREDDRCYLWIAAQWFTALPFFASVSGKLNPVMWSLIVEVHFYAVLPLVFIGFKRFSAKTCLCAIPALFIVVPAAARFCYLGHGLQLALTPLIEVRFPAQMDAFALGILIAGLETMGRLPKSAARLGDVGFLLLGAALVAQSAADLHPGHPYLREIIAYGAKLASGMLLCYIANPVHPRSMALCLPSLRWLGIVSYEIYLIHQPLLLWARNDWGPASGNVFKYALVLGTPVALTFLIAAGAYRYFSLPLLKFGRDRGGSRVRKTEHQRESKPLGIS